MLYFDYAATTPMSPAALQAYQKTAVSFYGNTQGLYDLGTNTANVVQSCRALFSEWLQADKEGIFFTGSASEANSLAIFGALEARPPEQRHVLYSPLEHPSVMMAVQKAERWLGAKGIELPLNKEGMVEVHEVERAINHDTGLIVMSHIASETGFTQPVQAVGQLVNHTPIHFHVDASQSFGKYSVFQPALYFDSCTLSAHKFYGPKGVGIAYISPTATFHPF
ncbi:aminotransferase class V-fold PLP-dependent enzyme, partial [Bacillaceae bacterium SIJ1]|uniref:cysteine desulfurase family protein n=1 Tax=Litoribacterium kuwaitense TaxID=1398745 RepID=UPI0013EA5781